MGWIRAKNAHWSRGLIRWTSYRKLRRCKISDEMISIDLPERCSINIWSDHEYESYEGQLATVGVSMSNNTINDNYVKTCSNLSNLRTCDTGHSSRLDSPRTEPGRGIRLKTCPQRTIKRPGAKLYGNNNNSHNKLTRILQIALLLLCCILNDFPTSTTSKLPEQTKRVPSILSFADASLIIGDSAIEIQEVDSGPAPSQKEQQQHQQQQHQQQQQQQQQQSPSVQSQVYDGQPSLILGSTDSLAGSMPSQVTGSGPQQQVDKSTAANKRGGPLPLNSMPSPLPPIANGESATASKSRASDDVTDGDKKSRNSHDYDLNEAHQLTGRQPEKNELSEVLSANQQPNERDPDYEHEKAITGKVVDFELTPAGGHNKAKIKKKKKKKKKEEEEAFKKWGKKKEAEKKAMEKKEKEHMKKKKEEGKKGKKKWGKEEHGQKKKGKFKKKKWGKKVKKGKGVKKGKKGKKFLKDKGHKNTGFKTVYHKEEWGKSSKWHDIKREKKWDEKSKKWKKKWKKEKGKKYKGDHMKKFEKKKKSGKKYKKEKKEKFKKAKKEEFKKGMKKKMEESGKKKEGGAKKQMKEEKKKKKKKKKS